MQIVVVGAGGHAKVILDILLCQGTYDIIGLTDPGYKPGNTVLGFPVLGDDDVLPALRREGVTGAFIAIGDNRLRSRLFDRVTEDGFELINAIHPRAIIAETVRIGRGVAVMAGGIINADASIGDNVIVNTGATVDHDCVIERDVHIAPGVHLGGNVHVKRRAFLGIGTAVIPEITIGEGAIIGAGSVVVDAISDYTLALGVPARPIRTLARGE